MISTLLGLSVLLANFVAADPAGVVMYSDRSCSRPEMIMFSNSTYTCMERSCTEGYFTAGMTATCSSDWEEYCYSVFKGAAYLLTVYFDDNCTGEPAGIGLKADKCTAMSVDSSVLATVGTDGSASLTWYSDLKCSQIHSSEAIPAADVSSHSCISDTKYYIGGTLSTTSTTRPTTKSNATTSATSSAPSTNTAAIFTKLALAFVGAVFVVL